MCHIFIYFSDFLAQVLDYIWEHWDAKICRFWLGPQPAVALFRAETVEVPKSYWPPAELSCLV